MSFGNGPKIVTNGLVLSLDAADQNSYVSGSTTWFDMSGNGNNGTLTNGPTFSSANGGNINFVSANSQYIDIQNSTSINPSTISIGSWFYLNSLITNQNIISKGYTSVALPYISYTLKMSSNSPFNTIDIQASIGGTNQTLTSFTTVTTGQWYNVVGTYDGSMFKLYINSIQDPITLSASGTITSYNTPLQIGRWGTQASQYFNGKIAIAQIYNRALSAYEIQQNYNSLKGRFNLT